MGLCFVIYMFLSNNPLSGGYKFVEFALFKLEIALHVYHMVDKLCVQELFYNDFLNPYH